MIEPKVLERFRVPPGEEVRLKDYATSWDQEEAFKKLGKGAVKRRAEEILALNRAELSRVQDVFYAFDRYALLLIFQAMDAAGKDGTIKHVMSGVNPQGCQVFSFKQPSAEDLEHDFLWRCARCLPERGRIGIFNRSYYEEVLVAKVHPEVLAAQKLPDGKTGKSFWQSRYEAINGFEHHLVRSGTIILKFFLHVSKKEQKKRFLERLDNPEKHWKFSAADLTERALWDDYQDAYETAIAATSTAWAPWYVVPADQKWVTRSIVSSVITSTLAGLGLSYPSVTDAQREVIAESRRALEAE
jgi:PPK2 family polyphosphate:nucleotide phosphotransferase